MPRILIAGCGYVGQAAADLFHQAGWAVHGWTQSEESPAKLSSNPYPVITVDIGEARQVGARPENFDAVIHCASTRGGDVDLYRRVSLWVLWSHRFSFAGFFVHFTSAADGVHPTPEDPGAGGRERQA